MDEYAGMIHQFDESSLSETIALTDGNRCLFHGSLLETVAFKLDYSIINE